MAIPAKPGPLNGQSHHSRHANGNGHSVHEEKGRLDGDASVAAATGPEHDDSWISDEDRERLRQIAKYDAQDSASRPHGIKSLPPGTKPTRLIGEGAANAVFEFKVPIGHPAANHFKRTLLRVAKVKKPGQATTFDYIFQYKYLLKDIQPRLPGYTMGQELVKTRHAEGLVDAMNAMLKAIDHDRREKFQGSWVGKTDWAFLVEDMRPDDPDEYELIEFKPKWLVQSPNAPKNAIRCRQCASGFHNFVAKPDTSRPLPKQHLCPLTLGRPQGGHYAFSSPFRIAPQLAALAESSVSRARFERVLDHVANHAVIQHLREIQRGLDTQGPLRAELNPNLPQAMTLRDCTCFALIPKRSWREDEEQIRISLGDFDWKDPKVKLERWRSREASLINGGFYTARRILCDGVYFRSPTLCLLEWASEDDSGTDVISALEVTTKEADARRPSQNGHPTMHMQESDADTIRNRLERHEAGLEGDVHDPASLKDPSR